MLPRVASTTGTLQPALAPQATVPVEAGRPQLSPAVLANLRAELLLRLIETMLRHIPRGPEGAAGRDLIESLFTALKSLPAREGEAGRRHADILARLPAELRPAADRLVATALAALPTRSLAGILRNPDAPEVHKLAALLAASLVAAAEEGEALSPATRQPQRFAGLTVQQLAAVNRHGGEQAGMQAGDNDARALQATLRRIFDPDGARTQPLPDRAAADPESADQPQRRAATRPADRMQAEPARMERPQTEQAGTRLPAETPVRATVRGSERSEAAAKALPPADDGRRPQGAETTEARSRETPQAQPGGRVPARSLPNVMQAVTGKAGPDVLMQALARLVESLSEEEVQVVRTLLERPLDTAADPVRTMRGLALPVPDDAAETVAGIPRPDEDAARPDALAPARREAESAQPLPARPAIAAENQPPAAAAKLSAEAMQAAALPETAAAVTLPLREGVPLAFVPYLTVDDDLAEAEEVREEEAVDEDGNDGDDAQQHDEPEDENEAEEPESPDMAARRMRTDELVGASEAGLAFPVRPGDYWT